MLLSTLELTQKFMAIRSDPDNSSALAEILALAASQLDGFGMERFSSNGYESLLVFNSSKRPERFKVLLNGHLDVIPGNPGLYKAVVKGDRIYGVGSMDMKASVASMINAFKDAASKVDYPLGLQIVTDEEIGGFHGTKYQIDQGVRADFVIAGESTGFNIVNQAKGILWAKVSCAGKAAHGAYPWAGENALWKMQEFLLRLKARYPIPEDQAWKTTVNLCKIETSNRSFNKVPEDCVVSLDIRFIPEESRGIEREIRKLLPRDFTLAIVANEPALNVKESDVHLQALRRAAELVTEKRVRFYGAQGSSDARHYTGIGCAGVEFGPLGGGIGTDEEWVSIASLDQFEQILGRFLLSEIGCDARSKRSAVSPLL